MDREVRVIADTWKVLHIYPLDDEKFTKVTGDFDPGSDVTGTLSQVRWPSVNLNTADARKFAAAIIEACDWVDEQGGMPEDYGPTMERFLEDVASHEMQIHLDQDVYRHLEFRQADKSWNHGFHIVTTPGRLMISGDMGTWVFCRIPDMFNFFRSPSGEINRGYWAEKCINGTSGGSREVKEYNGDVYKSRLIESLDNYDLTDEHKAMVIEELNEIDFDDEHWVISQIRDFEVDLDGEEPYVSTRELAKHGYSRQEERGKFSFQDVWEIDMTTYSYHFTWCLYAIAWAINQYDKAKSGEVRKNKINE